MNKALKMILVCILCLFGIVILYVAYILLVPTLFEFKPAQRIILPAHPADGRTLKAGEPHSIMTWNIGYAGLGKEMDFFYEGGKRVRPTRSEHNTYLRTISGILRDNDSLDLLLIQEVDFRSKRSYKTDQYEILASELPGFDAIGATNYKSPYVPSPALQPMGMVDAGQVTFSSVGFGSAERIATPGSYSWPMRLFMLKRCFLVTRIPVSNGKSLVVFNIHNSAFDDASDLRRLELDLLRNLILEAYRGGNYVIVGGDWNQNPPAWIQATESTYVLKQLWPIPTAFKPDGWKWAFDRTLPTNRDVHEPFSKESTTCTLIDFFLVSPNVQVHEVKTQDLEFLASDHLPVIMTFSFEK